MAMRGVYREITPPERLVSTESWGEQLAGNAQHADPLRGGGSDDDHEHGSLPIEGGSRCGAPDGDEGRRVRELRSSRRVPANDCMRLARGRSAIAALTARASRAAGNRGSVGQASLDAEAPDGQVAEVKWRWRAGGRKGFSARPVQSALPVDHRER
jgi:hypothetical protein